MFYLIINGIIVICLIIEIIQNVIENRKIKNIENRIKQLESKIEI
jgi:hypothetical protein